MKKTACQLMSVVCLFMFTACYNNSQVRGDKGDLQQQVTDSKEQREADLAELVALMSGEFDSLKQSEQDEKYYHISLKMRPIWTDLNEGHWLYVEQAVGNMLDKPYRQRVYHVTAMDNGKFSSAVYELPDAQAVIGGYEKPVLLANISPKDLKLRVGCAVLLTKKDTQSYQGSTAEKTCLSQLRGASYANSIVEITATSISSWDQGFDAVDKQVWGAVDGPYVFDRK